MGIAVDGCSQELTAANCKQLLQKCQLIIDTFDNSLARQTVKDYCAANSIPCLHVGLNSDYAEIIWNDIYRVPSPTNDDICDYPLARNLVMMAVAIASEVIITFVGSDRQESYTLTLADFAVKSFNF